MAKIPQGRIKRPCSWFARYVVREYLNRQRPSGKKDLQVEVAAMFGLASKLPPRGRPRIREVDLKAAGISSIVWATGFRSDFDWVELPIFDDGGEPVHQRGVTSLPGIYFLGIKWLYKRKSHFMANAGPAEDAAYLAQQITAWS